MQGTQEKVKNGKQGTVLCKKEKNNLKKYAEKGITLIALVVTIIILLILAGITINMLLGENGIIRTAQEAKNTWENAVANEQESLNSLLNELNEELGKNSRATDIYVFLYDDGTLTFGTQSEPIEGKTIVKQYGNIKGQEYKSWTDENAANNRMSDTPWFNEASLITKASIVDEIVPISMSSWFDSCINLTEFENIEKIDTSEVKSMLSMFDTCSSLATLDLSSFNTSNVTNMAAMFAHCGNLTEILGLENFNTGKVEDMASMFYACSSLTSLNLSGFDTSNVVDMQNIFNSCTNLTSLNLSSFNTNNVENMAAMFANCSSLTSLNLSGFDTSNVVVMYFMFQNCSGLTSLDLSNFDTSKTTDMQHMFNGCTNLTNLDLSGFDTSNVISTGWMFLSCSSLTNLDLSSLDTSSMQEMEAMFASCTNLTTIYVGDNWDLTNVENTNYMFENCGTNTTTPKPSNL